MKLKFKGFFVKEFDIRILVAIKDNAFKSVEVWWSGLIASSYMMNANDLRTGYKQVACIYDDR